MNDTIAAISTALGIGAVSIIRISGDQSISIVDKIFKGKSLINVPTHSINYGHIVDSDKVIDEVLVSVMKSPKTFTREDIVEINCHGGIATTNKVLELLLINGCRLAEPGEFTKRAFLNGRIDLVEADGVMNLINAKTEASRNLAYSQLSGKVSNLIKNLRQEIIEILANIEVNIDYPEYEDIEEVTNQKIISNLETIIEKINKMLQESNNGKIINEGIKVGIIGKPNVGKSSILNTLLEEDKAIVTDMPGTTRDIVEGIINLDGIILNIIDTAGIRDTSDIVEQIGVNKSLKIIDEADLIIFVLNNNDEISEDEMNIIKKLNKERDIIVINKIDLESNLDITSLKDFNIVKISALKNSGIDELKDVIKSVFNIEAIGSLDLTYLSSARSIALLNKSKEEMLSAIESIKNNMPIDIVEIDIKASWESLGEIIGETYQDELINQLFSQFCLGK